MATNAEFPPYESVDGETIVGVDVDMMQAVCDEIGMELKVENMEFDSIIAAVQSGKADVGVAGMTVTPTVRKTYPLHRAMQRRHRLSLSGKTNRRS